MPSPLKTQLNANVSPLVGRPAPREPLVDVARLEGEYYDRRPDLSDPTRMVSIGTSGHRGSSLTGAFIEAHILAVTQAICDYRQANGTDGPLEKLRSEAHPFH